MSARVLFQAPSSAICWFTYESLKHIISLQQTIEEKYETLADIRSSGVGGTTGVIGGSDKSKPGAEKGSDRLWETITDLPRPIHALETWAEQPNSALKYSESKFSAHIRRD